MSTFQKSDDSKPQSKPISEQVRAKSRLDDSLSGFSNNLPRIPKHSPLSKMSPEELNDLTHRIMCDNLSKEEIAKISSILLKREEINKRMKDINSVEEFSAIMKEHDTEENREVNQFMKEMEEIRENLLRRELPELYEGEVKSHKSKEKA